MIRPLIVLVMIVACGSCTASFAGKWVEVFHDPCGGNWMNQWFLEGDKAWVDNGTDGMTFSAGPVLNEHASHAVLWTKQRFEGDIKIEYDYTRIDTNMLAGVNILYIQATGLDAEEWPKDIFQSTAKRKEPWMKHYFLHMNLLHVSYATDGRYVSARRYPAKDVKSFNTATQFEPKFTDLDLFQPGELWHITAIKKDGILRFIGEHDGERHVFEWDLSQFPEVTEGRIGFRHMWTRCSRYRNVRISVWAND